MHQCCYNLGNTFRMLTHVTETSLFTAPKVSPLFFTSAGMEAWDMAAGMEMRLFTLPKLTVILNSFVTC